MYYIKYTSEIIDMTMDITEIWITLGTQDTERRHINNKK